MLTVVSRVADHSADKFSAGNSHWLYEVLTQYFDAIKVNHVRTDQLCFGLYFYIFAAVER
jgi:hypothetical protein